MVRMIDADAMLAELKPVTYEMEHSAVTIADVSNIMRDWVKRQPTLTPQNEPLTIEQLREMDGEPVWVVPKGSHEREEPMWCVLYEGLALLPGVDYWAWTIDGYGEIWIAYRRPPERQEGTHA